MHSVRQRMRGLIGRALGLVAVVASGYAPLAWGAAPVDLFPRAGAGYVVAVNGEVRWARNADVRRQPASLTKALAAQVLLDADWQPDAWVTIGPHAAGIEGSRLGLRRGERVQARALLEAMLVASANDACMALAEHAGGGDATTFVARMNARAAALGMSDSHFVHPCGLDQPGQYSTPNDLLRMAQAAMRVPELARIVALRDSAVRTEQGRALPFRTSNALLGRFDGADGLKTGQTTQAGKCVIAHVRRTGTEVFVVLLGAPDRWWTAAVLADEVFRASPR